MKNIFLTTFIFLISISSFAATTFHCEIESNPHHTALVAGETFDLSINSHFGYNDNFEQKALVQSEYLGDCEGSGSENMNPLTEGYLGMISVTGAQCAADGFDIYLSPGVEGLIQIGSENEAVFYNCSRH